MHIKKRASETLHNQWEIEEIPAKSRNITKYRRHLKPPPKAPKAKALWSWTYPLKLRWSVHQDPIVQTKIKKLLSPEDLDHNTSI